MKKILGILLLLPCLAFAFDSPEVAELKQLNQTLAEIKKDLKEIKIALTGDRFVKFGDGVLQKLDRIEKASSN